MSSYCLWISGGGRVDEVEQLSAAVDFLAKLCDTVSLVSSQPSASGGLILSLNVFSLRFFVANRLWMSTLQTGHIKWLISC